MINKEEIFMSKLNIFVLVPFKEELENIYVWLRYFSGTEPTQRLNRKIHIQKRSACVVKRVTRNLVM